MKKYIFILCVIALFITHIQAQDTELKISTKAKDTLSLPRLRLGVEAGINILSAETIKPEMIRENQSYYFDDDYDFHCGFVPSGQIYFLSYAGLKLEYSLSKRFAVSAGIRFSYNKTTFDSDREYFLWKISESDLSTNFIKINNIVQKNYYIGVPLSVRFFPNEKDYHVRHYFVAGTVLNFLVSSSQDVEFSKKSMEKYESQILEQIGEPATFQGTFFAGIGLKFGKLKYPVGNIELHFPVVLYGKENVNSLVKTKGAFGMALYTMFQIPIFKKQQLIYTVTN